ncbi:reverse transcriptase domain-containing protein [Streptomyces sp. NBC_00846]|uniref:reverse transcriptase domain-containing protein n=1 Tax=Streptomyces sp. NBC_00846 TaxID=2975849 RepID=UPI00386F165A|nr:reverse transcriptase domain-containing protein [Streptomyces sp. NBC_00846]
MGPWKPGGEMSLAWERGYRRRRGLPNWRLVRYADDFVVLVNGTRQDTEAVREDVSRVLKPLGLNLSETKTQITNLADGIDFLGFHIQWRRKKGTEKWHVYTFVSRRPIRQLKAKIRALTRRQSQ